MNTSFSKPPLLTVLKTGVITGVIAAVINLALWFVVQLVTPLKFPLAFIPVMSILLITVGSLIYWVLTRVAGARAPRLFLIIAVIFLVLDAFAPISAMSMPSQPGAELFNLPTVIVAEIMHLIAGYLAITRIPKAA